MSAAIHGLSHKALKHFRKNPAALAVYWVYVARTNPEGVAFPSIIGLSKDTGYCKATCQKARDWLISVKALELREGYIRPEFRELEEKDKKRKMNLDKAEYYHVTGHVEIKGERIHMLYHGAIEKSDIDYANNDVLSYRHPTPSDIVPDRTPTPSNVETVEEELNTIKELNTRKIGASESDAGKAINPESTPPSEQGQVLKISRSDSSKKKDKKPPSSARPPKQRERNLVFDALAECAFGILPTTAITKDAKGRIGALEKAARDAFWAVYGVDDRSQDDKLSNAVRIYYQLNYPQGGKLTAVRSVPTFGADFLAFVQNYRKPKPESSLHSMPELPAAYEWTPDEIAKVKSEALNIVPQEKTA